MNHPWRTHLGYQKQKQSFHCDSMGHVFSLPTGLLTYHWYDHLNCVCLQRRTVPACMCRKWIAKNDNKKKLNVAVGVTVNTVTAWYRLSADTLKFPAALPRVGGTMWSGAYVLQRADWMEHVCIEPQAAGLMFSHLAALLQVPHSNQRPRLDVCMWKESLISHITVSQQFSSVPLICRLRVKSSNKLSHLVKTAKTNIFGGAY